jgi:hypothetical protein
MPLSWPLIEFDCSQLVWILKMPRTAKLVQNLKPWVDQACNIQQSFPTVKYVKGCIELMGWAWLSLKADHSFMRAPQTFCLQHSAVSNSDPNHDLLILRLMQVACLLLQEYPDNLLVVAEIILSLIIKTSHLTIQKGRLNLLRSKDLPRLACQFWFTFAGLQALRFALYKKPSWPVYKLQCTHSIVYASEKSAWLGINQDITADTSSYWPHGLHCPHQSSSNDQWRSQDLYTQAATSLGA